MNDLANFNHDAGSQRARKLKHASLQPQTIAHVLGWFSIALGVAELLAPRAISRSAGLESNRALVRLYGLRELACGIGILVSGKPVPFLWARVGGDALDIATVVARADTSNGRDRNRAYRALANLLGVTALDLYAAQGMSADSSPQLARPMRDYSDRTGFPSAAAEMRGAARASFEMPRDMRGPDALRPWTVSGDGDVPASSSEH